MFGNILSDAEIIRLRESHLLTLEPFDVTRLKVAHYKLSPRTVWELETRPDGRTGKKQVHEFEDDAEYVFPANAYRLIEVEETVLLPDGVVASFLPVSEFAFRGFALVAGMLDAGYGKLAGKTQKLVFGVKNLQDCTNVFAKEFGLAHISFISLTGASLLRQDLSSAEIERLKGRDPRRWIRANDDGIFYPQG